MSYAFVSHGSACEALRTHGAAGQAWPETSRMLPHRGSCIRLQREMAQLERTVDFRSLGIISEPIDILVPSSSVRSRGKRATTHSWLTAIPAHAMRRVHENVIVSGPEFVILQMAHRHIMHIPVYDKMVDKHLEDRELLRRYGIDDNIPAEDLLGWEHVRHLVSLARLAMEFAGTYRLSTPMTETAYKQPRLMTIQSALDFVDMSRNQNDGPRARRALSLAADGSRSPMETALFLMLTLPIEMGGYGIAKPVLNKPVPVQLDKDDLIPDLLWEEHGLVVEYQSDEFHESKGRDRTDHDIMRANELRAEGYQVLEATPGIVCDPSRMEMLANQVARLLGTRLPSLDEAQMQLRRHLHGELFLNTGY